MNERTTQGYPWVDRQCPDSDAVCPNCGCKQVYEIRVEIKDARLVGGHGVGMYLGCPACPWASPAVMVAAPPAEATGGLADAATDHNGGDRHGPQLRQ